MFVLGSSAEKLEFEKAMFTAIIFQTPSICYYDLNRLLDIIEQAEDLVQRATQAMRDEWPERFQEDEPRNGGTPMAHWRYDVDADTVTNLPEHSDGSHGPAVGHKFQLSEAIYISGHIEGVGGFYSRVLGFWAALVTLGGHPGEGPGAADNWHHRFVYEVLFRRYQVLHTVVDHHPLVTGFGSPEGLKLTRLEFDVLAGSYWDRARTFYVQGSHLPNPGGSEQCSGVQGGKCKDYVEFVKAFGIHNNGNQVFGSHNNGNPDDFETCFRRLFLKRCLGLPEDIINGWNLDYGDMTLHVRPWNETKESMIQNLWVDLQETLMSSGFLMRFFESEWEGARSRAREFERLYQNLSTR